MCPCNLFTFAAAIFYILDLPKSPCLYFYCRHFLYTWLATIKSITFAAATINHVQSWLKSLVTKGKGSARLIVFLLMHPNHWQVKQIQQINGCATTLLPSMCACDLWWFKFGPLILRVWDWDLIFAISMSCDFESEIVRTNVPYLLWIMNYYLPIAAILWCQHIWFAAAISCLLFVLQIVKLDDATLWCQHGNMYDVVLPFVGCHLWS
jgi:hypothetical protein